MTKTKTNAKPKTSKSNAQETLVNFILDKSGSMSGIQQATISGFNEYLNTLKKDGNKYSLSLTLFDTLTTKPYLNVDIKDVKELNETSYIPSGMTALYDAVCSTIEQVKRTVKDNQKVITVIMTDGEENSSQEFSQKDLRDKIQELEKSGKWSFVFLGANQDSFANAGAVGIGAMNTATFTATDYGMKNAMHTVARGTSNFAMSASASTNTFFSKSDQDNLSSNLDNQTAKVDPLVNISQSSGAVSRHFSDLGKKSWDSRRKKLLGE